jgi:hypothetical protein
MTEHNEHSVPEPPNALLSDSRPTSARNDSFNDREAFELHNIQTREDDDLDYPDPSGSSSDEYHGTVRRTASRTDSQRELQARNGVWGRICRFWARHVSITVSQKANRDHFGMFDIVFAAGFD